MGRAFVEQPAELIDLRLVRGVTEPLPLEPRGDERHRDRHRGGAATLTIATASATAQSPYERPITSSITSSVPAPIRFRRMSRQARSMPYSFM